MVVIIIQFSILETTNQKHVELTCFPPLHNWRWNQLFWCPTQSSWQSAFCYKWLRQISSHKYNFIWCAVIIIIIIGLTHLFRKKNDSSWSFPLLIVKTLPDENKELENFKPRSFIKCKNSLWKTIRPSGCNSCNTLYSSCVWSILHSVFAKVKSSWQSYLCLLVLVTYCTWLRKTEFILKYHLATFMNSFRRRQYWCE